MLPYYKAATGVAVFARVHWSGRKSGPWSRRRLYTLRYLE